MTDALLAIDVGAELRKVSSRLYPSRADLLVDLVRALVRHGASSIGIRRRWRGLEVRAIGSRLPSGLVPELAVVVGQGSDEARHRALELCEAQGGEVFVALLALPALRLSHGGHRLRLDARRRPRLGAVAGDGFVVWIGGPLRYQERARLAKACAHASVPITLDGRALPRAASEGLLVERFSEGGLEVEAELPMSGDVSVIVVLEHGIVRREIYHVPRAGTVSVVRIWRQAGAGSLPQATVEAASRHAAQRLYTRLARELGSLPAAVRRRGSRLLLRQAAQGRALEVLRDVPLFVRLDGVAMDAPGMVAMAVDGVLWALGPGDRHRLDAASAGRVFLLDEVERAFIATALGLHVARPPGGPQRGWRARLHVAATRGQRLAAATRAWLAKFAPTGKPIDDAALTPAERQVVAAVTGELEAGRFRLPRRTNAESRTARVVGVGRGGPQATVRRVGSRLEVRLPLRHAGLASFLAPGGIDPRDIYPLMALWFDGYDGYGHHKRSLHRDLMARAGG